MRLPWPGLTRPVRLVQLSDLHWGNGPAENVRQGIARTVALRPDVVVITGDFVDDRGSGLGGLAEALAPLRGAYAVFGDHDYDTDLPGVARILEQAGIHPLVNRAVRLPEGLWLAGVDDLERGCPDFRAALADLPAQGGLLLSHNPLAFEVLEERPLTILSGHTHGAQIRIPFPWPSLVCRVHLGVRTVQGWHHRGRLSLYVNRGLGVAGPWPLNRRLFCPPEVTVFDLEPSSR